MAPWSLVSASIIAPVILVKTEVLNGADGRSCFNRVNESILLQIDGRYGINRNTTQNTLSLLQDELEGLEGNQVSNEERNHFQLVKNLRARGFRCPDGTYFPPNNGPLEWDCRLSRAAEGWSQRMGTEGFEGHRYGGSTPCQRTEAQGYPAQRGCGENLAMGKGNPQDALVQLQKSNDHCKNMMNPEYNMLGVGHFYNVNSKYRHYWTDSFGSWHQKPDQSCIGGSPAPSPPPGCADQDTLHCQTYKSQGYCQVSENVQRMCKDTCGIGNCGQQSQPSPSPPLTAPGTCEDTVGSCDYYRSQGYCSSSDNVRNGCRKTCGLCSSQCADTDGACAYYRDNGYCTSDHIKQHCRRSCGQC